MRYLRIIPAHLLLFVVTAACQPAESTPLVPEGVQNAQTATPGLSPESMQKQTDSSVLTPEDTDMVSPIIPDVTSQKMVDLAKEHLARKLGIAVDQIVLSEVKPVVWRDAGLGCPKPGVDYIQVETPGYSIVLETGGKTYNYHTDEVNRIILCNR